MDKELITLSEKLASQYNLNKEMFINTVKKTIMPGAKSNEEITAFLSVADIYNLNPFTKEIWAFPTRSGGIMPMVSFDGWTKIVNAHSQYDGMEIQTMFDEKNKTKPFASTCTIYRKDRTRPTIKTVYYSEWVQEKSPVWRTQPIHMLEIRAFIQCARVAFSLSGIADPDAKFIDLHSSKTIDALNYKNKEYSAESINVLNQVPLNKTIEAPKSIENNVVPSLMQTDLETGEMLIENDQQDMFINPEIEKKAIEKWGTK